MGRFRTCFFTICKTWKLTVEDRKSNNNLYQMTRKSKAPLVIFVTSVFDDPKTGPATYARILYKYYKKDGINFKIITSDCAQPDPNIISVQKTYIRSLIYYKLWKKAKETIAEYPENYTIVHFNNAFPYLYFGKLGDKTLTQVNDYYTASTGLYHFNLLKPKAYIRHHLRKFTESHSLNRADLILFNSKYTRDFLLKRYTLIPDKCEVIYKSIDPVKLNYIHNENKTGCILFIGNNYYLKGLDILLDATTILSEELTIYIAGPSKLDEKLLTRIKDIPSTITINLLGSMKQDELYELMRKCDILVIPARVEALGVSVIEALAQGLPVITSGEGGLKEVLEGYPEICYNSKNLDPTILAENIKMVLNNYPFYNKLFRSNQEKITDKFNPRIMLNKLYKAYGI